MDLYWRPLSPPIIPPEHPYYSREDVRNASRHPLHIVAAGSYCPRPPSPPPLCVDPRDVDPGYGFPKTEEERSYYPLTLDYLSDPEPAESESSSSRASSATPSCSDDESVSISPTRSATALPSPKKKRTTQSPKKKVTSHPYGEKNKTTTDVWGRQLETCKLCGTRVQSDFYILNSPTRQPLKPYGPSHRLPGIDAPLSHAAISACGLFTGCSKVSQFPVLSSSPISHRHTRPAFRRVCEPQRGIVVVDGGTANRRRTHGGYVVTRGYQSGGEASLEAFHALSLPSASTPSQSPLPTRWSAAGVMVERIMCLDADGSLAQLKEGLRSKLTDEGCVEMSQTALSPPDTSATPESTSGVVDESDAGLLDVSTSDGEVRDTVILALDLLRHAFKLMPNIS
ncbi:hypothetical protein GSI_10321 [Ganoderma sinense ZZ0214-1]|uniref:Uncharacterized protein n=1 Tax=Ganoderma sinense ZZ0214-1 TaxID=1077348 RepID=A0A2G8S082_9APHY|nr:hypothetical protein GSI_10321 [Ganoderma sinense ZZ0214-1]